MNNQRIQSLSHLCADIGYKSINHDGELLCGDHVDIVSNDDGSTIVVLADGLGSGVKASILSTLTSKIISTMMAAGLSLEDCVSTMAATLPICSVRGVAYSTFTIIHLKQEHVAELIQYDNPQIIWIRDGKRYDYPKTETTIGGKTIYQSTVTLCENDLIIAMSDGCPHAGIGTAYNFGWKLDDIAAFMEDFANLDYNAKTLSTMLVDTCNRLYDNHPGDDATACVIKIRKRAPMNLLFGPPSRRDDCDRMMSLFFSKEGKHIICGGTTASIAAKYLRKPIRPSIQYHNSDIPPTAEIDGVDLVTEGMITVSKVLEYAKDALADNEQYELWGYQQDGASKICRLLFEEATDINFFVGKAVNPAHQNPGLPINFTIKMNLVKELAECLTTMGKRVKLLYF